MFLEPEHVPERMMEMMIMKMTRMKTEGKAGMTKLQRIKEERMRDPQKMMVQKQRIGFPAY